MKLKITIDDRTFEVEVEVAEPDHAALPPAYPVGSAVLSGIPAPVAPAPHGAAVNEEKVCRSPVSGIVVKVIARVGQSLQVGDALMQLEAMKMETNLTAPIAGRVASVRVDKGDNVQAGQVLIEFE